MLDYNIDWSPRLTPPDTIVTSEWFVPVGLVNENEEMDPTGSTTVWLSAGIEPEKYEILNRVTTLEGRTMDQTVTLQIKTK